MLTTMSARGRLKTELVDNVRDVLLRQHVHQYERSKHLIPGDKCSSQGSGFMCTVRSIAEIGRSLSHGVNLFNLGATPCGSVTDVRQVEQNVTQKQSVTSSPYLRLPQPGSLPENLEQALADTTFKGNQHLMKKIPPDSEACNVLIGEVGFLETPVCSFVRLRNSAILGDLTEVPVPTRFLFLLLGPCNSSGGPYRDIGRAIATLMADDVFHDVAYKARRRADLLDGLDEFLDQVIVLPPGEWDPAIRIEPPASIPSQEKRKETQNKEEKPPELDDVVDGFCGLDHGLERTDRLFGGLFADIRRKSAWYLSDFRDAFHPQCLASFLFLYFVTLMPIVIYGDLLAKVTNDDIVSFICMVLRLMLGKMFANDEKRQKYKENAYVEAGRKFVSIKLAIFVGIAENLISVTICGIVYHLFAGQPLTLLGSTGPVLAFELIICSICKQWDLLYLPLRFWIGVFMSLMLVWFVATDASAIVVYITPFTLEAFVCLAVFIFIIEAFKHTLAIIHQSLVLGLYPPTSASLCYCVPPNVQPSAQSIQKVMANEGLDPVGPSSWLIINSNATEGLLSVRWSNVDLSICHKLGGSLFGSGCFQIRDAFLMSLLLFVCTVCLAFAFKSVRYTVYFPAKIRETVSDFAVVLAMVAVVSLDYTLGFRTPKLQLPKTLGLTRSNRGWIVDPFTNSHWWIIFLALPLAFLGSLVLFMNQHMTSVIVNRCQNQLKKGVGYHLDLFVVAILIPLCAILGLPFCVASTVLSITHVDSLRLESECAAVGAKPAFKGIREQRVTGLLVFITIGLSVLMADALNIIPLPVLYGIFLYMGISSLHGIQLVNRLLLLAIPMKYQPDYSFLRHVPIRRVHIFTLFQLLCLVAGLIMVKFKPTSIVVPLMVVIIIGVRKLMEYMFTIRELELLDSIMPTFGFRKQDNAPKADEKDLTTNTKQNVAINGVKAETGPNGGLRRHRPQTLPVTVQRPMMDLSKEMNKSGVWRSIASDSRLSFRGTHSCPSSVKVESKRQCSKLCSNPLDSLISPDIASVANKEGASRPADEEDDLGGIMITVHKPSPHELELNPLLCDTLKNKSDLENRKCGSPV